jgi:hypothetical protein
VPAFTVGAALLMALVAAAFCLRVAAIAVLRHRHPEAAALVVRHWTWVPVLGVLTLAVWTAGPAGLLLGAVAAGVVAARPGLFGLPSR